MKHKNEIRKQILQRFISKSNQVINDIDKLTSHMNATHKNTNEKVRLSPLHSSSDLKN